MRYTIVQKGSDGPLRKQMQVANQINTIVQDMKKELELGSASEVIGYLYTLYRNRQKEITLHEHKRAIHDMKEILNQQSM